MANEKTCPHCGKPVPGTALQDICPECMLKAGMAPTEAAGPHGTVRVTPTAPPTPSELATLFPQLEILECLGQGGMGAVYKARQPRLNRFVALKVLSRDREHDPLFAERFAREAQALARLNHPNVVAVYDFGEAGGRFFLLMEFVDGLNLRQMLRSGKMAPEQALTIVPRICEALQYAHEQGVVHRDIKPENILVDKTGRVKIADFGIAKLAGAPAGEAMLTGAQDVMGTPHYMAPEQVEKPREVDHRADIYSLGVVFYEMLTGELPLGRFAPPSQKVQVDVRLDEIVLRALEKEPARRYQQAGQFKTQVETVSTARMGSALPRPPQQHINWIPALVFYAVQMLLVVPAELAFLNGNAQSWASFLALDLIALAMAYTFWGILHYRCWSALPEEYRATTPGQAVGFLFIPFFNFYWVFVSLVKLAEGFNVLRAAGGPQGIRDLKALAIAKAVLFIGCWTLAFLPGLAAIVTAIDLVIFILFYRGIVANANLLISSGAAGKGVLPGPSIYWKLATAGLVFLFVLAAALAFPALRKIHRKLDQPRVDIRYRVFEADAALVDKWIPIEKRRGGVMPTSHAVDRGPMKSVRSVSIGGSNRMFTIEGQLAQTDAQLSEIDRGTLESLLNGVPEHLGVLVDRRRQIEWWPNVSDTWSGTRGDLQLSGTSTGNGYLGARRKNGALQVRIDYQLQYKLDAYGRSDSDVLSLIRYEGEIPSTGVMAFLVPFVRGRNASAHYLVVVFELEDKRIQARGRTCAPMPISPCRAEISLPREHG